MDAQKIIEELVKILARKNGAEIKIKKIVKKGEHTWLYCGSCHAGETKEP